MSSVCGRHLHNIRSIAMRAAPAVRMTLTADAAMRLSQKDIRSRQDNLAHAAQAAVTALATAVAVQQAPLQWQHVDLEAAVYGHRDMQYILRGGEVVE